MRRLTTFIVGMMAGGALVYALLHYHVIRSKSGLHLVPKVKPSFAGAYVDVCNFAPGDWTRRPDLAMALLKANRADLLEGAASDSLNTGLDKLLPPRAP